MEQIGTACRMINCEQFAPLLTYSKVFRVLTFYLQINTSTVHVNLKCMHAQLPVLPTVCGDEGRGTTGDRDRRPLLLIVMTMIVWN
jgi:hypothetical protein